MSIEIYLKLCQITIHCHTLILAILLKKKWHICSLIYIAISLKLSNLMHVLFTYIIYFWAMNIICAHCLFLFCKKIVFYICNIILLHIMWIFWFIISYAVFYKIFISDHYLSHYNHICKYVHMCFLKFGKNFLSSKNVIFPDTVLACRWLK